MQCIRVGVIGAGGVAQVEHIPNLLKLHRQFKIVGVYDPSRKVRAFVGEEFGLKTFSDLDALLAMPLDAVVIASPDALHREQTLAAFARGLHVFCEKPLCYSAGDIDDLIAARDRAGKVLQVGYMKRFDPSYEATLKMLPGTARTLRYISVEVNDPDAWPFVRHASTCRGDDVAEGLIASTEAKQREQVARAVPGMDDPDAFRGFVGAYASSIVHDVNAVHGLLDALGVTDGEIIGASLFAKGEGGQGTVRLLGGQALWTMTHIATPGLPDYRERITLFFDDASLELEFPSPYLNHQPTRLTLRTGDGHTLSSRDIRSGYEEAFVEELKGFWSAIVEGTPARNTAEHARRDMTLLAGLARHHLAQLKQSGVRP
ncbi:Gfo/Idh/MocA family protein [Mesorhizobium loti]|uniref:Gfo/Idh/MocA family oxidoreductase n=1 Tax=Mesorhizobium loti R88b TaxID=935548 RepID=A0A6M7WLF4_RHILI|nr:Gfo/Idh/MocA family oxidoreductase [Mesorhizobium loti]QKD02436.1 gfo/Idh/MocA family oxidoreductase [Mesorhizobium loti R88b]